MILRLDVMYEIFVYTGNLKRAPIYYIFLQIEKWKIDCLSHYVSDREK